MTYTIKIPKNVADRIRTLPKDEESFYYFIGIDGPNELILLTLAPSSLMEEYGERSDLDPCAFFEVLIFVRVQTPACLKEQTH
jgi:hypothetical protein